MKAVNLIPAAQREGAAVGAGHSEGGAYAVLALLAGVALLAVLYGMAKHDLSSRRAQAASLTAQAQSAQSAASQLAPYTTFVSLRDQRIAAVNTLVESRFDWAHAFHEFGRTVPFGVSFNSLQGTVGSGSSSATVAKPVTSASATAATAGAPVASATPPGSVPTFTLAGCAISQATVARMLERLRLIDGVKDVSLQSSTAAAPTPGGTGGGAGGGCAGGEPAFSVTIAFAPMPVPVAPPASTSASTVADSAGSAPSTSTSASYGSAAR
jgi:Tfp pilus assembly protein PilN